MLSLSNPLVGSSNNITFWFSITDWIIAAFCRIPKLYFFIAIFELRSNENKSQYFSHISYENLFFKLYKNFKLYNNDSFSINDGFSITAPILQSSL